MELLGQTLLLYGLVGVAIAVAVYLSEFNGTRGERWFRVGTALPFWPLYLPILLARSHVAPPEPAPIAAALPDEMTAAIAQVDAELDAALNSLDGWASDVLAREKGRIRELRAAWTAQAGRIREMDRLLTLPDNAVSVADAGTAANERLRNSQRARQQNLERLRRVRQRAYDDLMGMLAWVRELVSMIHLAKFTGAPAARAEELVAQIAAAVEGLSEVSMQEDVLAGDFSATAATSKLPSSA
jgi:hypothetical protein